MLHRGWRPRAQLRGQSHNPLHEHFVGRRHALRVVEIVLKPNAHMAAKQDGRIRQRELRPPDAGDRPGALGRDRLRHVEQVANRRGNAPGHAHDKVEVERQPENALPHQEQGVVDVAQIEGLNFGDNALLRHGPGKVLDQVRRVPEDALAKVDRACGQAGHFRLEQDRLDALLCAHADRAARGHLHNHI